MPSSLRARLNAIAGAQNAAPQKTRSSGVLVREHDAPLDERLLNLDIEGLRRIGWTGGAFDARSCAFLDTETTGLSGGVGTVAFLVGIGKIESGVFRVRQYLMRDYADEAELLSRVRDDLHAVETICSFNGNKFDLPLLETRFTMNRMRGEFPETQRLDLLYPARRTWKLRIGSCRLSHIEEEILGMRREGDLPGSEVPQRYFKYLKCGDLTLLEDIIDHNRQDIVTLGTLLAHLAGLYAYPEAEKHEKDLFSMGKALERQGELRKAKELYRIAAIPKSIGTIQRLREGSDGVAAQAAWRIYLIERRNGNAQAMREALESMASRGQLRDRIYIELAKYYEHREKKPARALRYANLAAKYVPAEERAALEKRRARLMKKIESENKTHGSV